MKQQKLSAYENGSPVLTARLSSGRSGAETPTGQLRVERKRPSRHMAASDGGGNGFDLPGVPGVAYIHWSGVAFHGTPKVAQRFWPPAQPGLRPRRRHPR